MPDLNDYLLDVGDAQWAELMADWSFVVPEDFTVWFANRFGNVFMVYPDGSVHLLIIDDGTLLCLAEGREQFALAIDRGNNASEWLMMPLIDACVAAGLTLTPGRCYGFKQLPVLGGTFETDNIEVIDVAVYFSLAAQINEQIRDMPPGTKVRFKIGPEPA